MPQNGKRSNRFFFFFGFLIPEGTKELRGLLSKEKGHWGIFAM